jgi:hypothetical protein
MRAVRSPVGPCTTDVVDKGIASRARHVARIASGGAARPWGALRILTAWESPRRRRHVGGRCAPDEPATRWSCGHGWASLCADRARSALSHPIPARPAGGEPAHGEQASGFPARGRSAASRWSRAPRVTRVGRAAARSARAPPARCIRRPRVRNAGRSAAARLIVVVTSAMGRQRGVSAGRHHGAATIPRSAGDRPSPTPGLGGQRAGLNTARPAHQRLLGGLPLAVDLPTLRNPESPGLDDHDDAGRRRDVRHGDRRRRTGAAPRGIGHATSGLGTSARGASGRPSA